MTEIRRRRALITRPQEDAADVAVALARRGITPVLAPMMRILPAEANIAADAMAAQAVLFTSRNGVRAFCRLTGLRDIVAFAVGDSTAALARGNGFATVHSAGGDSDDLARLVIETLRPDDGPLFHAAGETVAGSLSEQLSAAGFRVLRRTLYSAEPIDKLTPETQAALQKGTLDYVLFFSPRTARIFVERVAAAGLTASCARLTAVCLSPAVAEGLDPASWRKIEAAREPTTEALTELLDRLESAALVSGPRLAPAAVLPVAADAPPASGTAPKTEAPGDRRTEETDKLVEPMGESDQKPSKDERPAAPGPWDSRIPPAGDDPGGGPAPDLPSGGSAPGGWVAATSELARAVRAAAADDQGGPMTERRDARDTEGDRSGDSAGDKAGAAAPAAASAGSSAASPGVSSAASSGAASSAPPREALPEFLSGGGPAGPAPRRSRSAAVAWTLVVIAVVAGAGYATLPYWRDRIPEALRAHLGGPDAQQGDVVAALRSEVSAARVAAVAATEALTDVRRGQRDLADRLAMVNGRLAALDDLAARVAASEAAIEKLRAAGPAADASAIAPLAERLGKIEATLDSALRARTGAQQEAAANERRQVETAEKTGELVRALVARTGALEAQLETVRKSAVASGHADSLALAVAQLRDALARSSPFAAELATLRKIAGDDPNIAAAIAPVLPFADAGIPTRATLFGRLPAVIDAAAADSRSAPAGDWMDRIVGKLRDFVSVRRIDGKGAGADAMMARAEMAARRDDLAAAVRELSGLGGAASGAAKPWLAAARARLAADEAGIALNRALLAGVAGGAGK